MNQKIKNSIFSSVIFVIVTCLFSLLMGKDAGFSWLAAAAICVTGGIVSFAVIEYGAVFKGKPLLPVVLMAGIVRLLLIMSGSVIIILFIRINITWFVTWLLFFYAAILAIEIRLAMLSAGDRPGL